MKLTLLTQSILKEPADPKPLTGQEKDTASDAREWRVTGPLD
jgi:hypothetical protein